MNELADDWVLPSVYARNIFEIDFDKWWDEGIRLIGWDVDNTLVPIDEDQVSVETRRLFERLRRKGFVLILISNTVIPSREKRVDKIAKSIWNKLQYICLNLFRLKPKIFGFLDACEETGIPPSRAGYVGDQWRRDICGAFNAGYAKTALVDPLGRDSIVTLRSRRKERPHRNKLKTIGYYQSLSTDLTRGDSS